MSIKVKNMKQFNENHNKNLSREPSKKNFAFPGSEMHEVPIFSFTIEHMSLRIQPDFVKQTLVDCNQQLRVRAFQDISHISLDISEIRINEIESLSIDISNFRCTNDQKLIIEFSELFRRGSTVDINISYSTGYNEIESSSGFTSPRNGFHFITKNSQDRQIPAYQTWTQGQATESPYWFPCVDSPQMKFTLDIEVICPREFMVISNGILASKLTEHEITVWKFIEKNPLPSYLVSVVIGRFSVVESNYNNIPLYYYWPEEINKDDAMLTFAETPHMIGFFEEYFNTKFPFQKYSQSAVDNFEFGGMENSSCTTLTRNVLHDKITSMDYRNDIFLVVHELAHQWFGDMVTCKDWSHIWLNEGFATYCELLYWERTRGMDEFHYNLIKNTDIYFEEAKDQYHRPIVTKFYKHPDELFDAHAYEKAGFILHMLRSYLGEFNFRKSLKTYLTQYQHKSAESLDLLRILEETSGIEMHSFFDQWIYREGHPDLQIDFILEDIDSKADGNSTKNLTVKIRQGNDNLNGAEKSIHYKFQLEIKINLLDGTGKKRQILHLMDVDTYTSESTVFIDRNLSLGIISIDPDFKVLKNINSIKILNETEDFQLKRLLVNQMKNGDTVIERVNAVRLLKNLYSEEIITALQDRITGDIFYGVSVEAANAIGSFYDKNNYEKSDRAYQALISILKNRASFDNFRPEIKKAIVKNIGIFERSNSIELLENFIQTSNTDSIFVKSVAATAIGKSCKGLLNKKEKEGIISVLKKLVDTTNTFQSNLATGALEGLKELSKEKDQDIYLEVVNFFLENTDQSKEYFVRAKATACLGKFLTYKSDPINPIVTNMNLGVFNRLKELLRDDRRKIKMNACTALSDDDAKFDIFPDKRTYDSIEELITIARSDKDGFVRRKAEVSANIIRQWIAKWANKPLKIDTKLDVGNGNLR
ncbi:M1 family metallopeptidase [Candidatus Nitrosocosmicus arcticus]|uniref:M1 family metallopeptidase n=1 Tax=Candidatus Nitrosocosmicus arcticus TaxID=2035267 RepID=UPI0011A42ABC|nr:M1 family metallopeptidase [Candidatus Nitrosocosmicus arcticus]